MKSFTIGGETIMLKCPECGENLVAKVERNGVGSRGEYSDLPKPVTKYECQGCGHRPKRKDLVE